MDMDPYARMVARAVQTYGMVLRDKAGAVVLYAENPANRYAEDPYTKTDGILGCPNGQPAPAQLQRTPAERVRHLSPPSDFDRVEVLKAVARSGARAIVVGDVAGALHGWPLRLQRGDHIELVVHGSDRTLIDAVASATEGVRVVDTLPGTGGYVDLVRRHELVDVDGVSVAVTGLVDLLRITFADSDAYRLRRRAALDKTLECHARGLQDRAPVQVAGLQAREAIDAWRQT